MHYYVISNIPPHIEPLLILKKPSLRPPISPRTFAHCLNALWINTEVLLSNTTNFNLFTITAQPQKGKPWGEKMNRFQQVLARHSVELQQQIIASGSRLASYEIWETYADLWTVQDAADSQMALLSLEKAAGLLADLYENGLVLAAQQPGRANNLYLFAHHLTDLHSFLIDSENTDLNTVYGRKR